MTEAAASIIIEDGGREGPIENGMLSTWMTTNIFMRMWLSWGVSPKRRQVFIRLDGCTADDAEA
jgi:hypothetical protein